MDRSEWTVFRFDCDLAMWSDDVIVGCLRNDASSICPELCRYICCPKIHKEVVKECT